MPERKLALARPLAWTPDTSFRERDQELGSDLTVPIFAPNGVLTELSGDVLRVLSAFGRGATTAEVCRRLEVDADGAREIEALAESLVARGFLREAEPPARPAGPVPPILSTSAHGCGGTLLRWFLDAHPRLACAPPHRLGNRLREMIAQASKTDGFTSLGLDPRDGVQALGQTVGELFGLHARLRQRDGWVWASRDHDLCLQFLDDLFAGAARFVFVVRHPFDAAESSARRSAETGWQAARMLEQLHRHDDPHVAYAHYWAGIYRRLAAFREGHPDRVHVVRYEDLVRQTPETLDRLLGFLGLEPVPGLVDQAFQQPHEMLEGGWESFAFQRAARVTADQIGLWQGWDEARLKRVTAVVEELLPSYGYTPADR